jgi:hypothetical protein
VPGNDEKGRFLSFYELINIDGIVKSPSAVIPAQAGIQKLLKRLDPRQQIVSGGDEKG